MDGLIAVCHFCEQHGPSVVFCTQAHQQLVSHELQALISSRKGQSLDGCNSTVAHGEQEASDRCAACMAFPVNKESCLVSHSEGTGVSYVSSRGPLHAQLTSLVKRACVRSLSCEVCPGGEGCVYFGDDVRGHVLSYTFSLRDVHARGLKRWYSILVVVRDHVYLLSAWTFLVNKLQQVVQQLQDRAAQVFTSEGGVTGRQKAEQPRRHRVSSRGLQELVNFPNIWQRLHTAHVWLMLAVGERVLEVIGGTVASMTSQGAGHLSQAVEDKSLGEEHKSLGEEHKSLGDQNVSGRSSQLNSAVPEELMSVMERSIEEPLTTRQLRSLLGPDQFELLLQSVLLGFPLVLRCHLSTACVLPNIVRALKQLVPSFLHHLISVQGKSSTSPSPAASRAVGNVSIENLNIFETDLDVRLKNINIESNIVADPITNVFNSCSTSKVEVCTSASNHNLQRPSTVGSSSLGSIEPALPHTGKSVGSLSTLTSSPSIEVYDALDMDTLVLDISYKLQQCGEKEDSNKNNSIHHNDDGGRDLINSTNSQGYAPGEQQWNRQQQQQGTSKRLSLELPPALNSCSPIEILQHCEFKLVYRCEAASPWQRRVCGAARSITAACNNTALRDDTLALTIQHTLQQWRNKVKLWEGLIKQHQQQNRSGSGGASTTGGDLIDAPLTATAVPTIFSTPLSLPSFLTGYHKTKPQTLQPAQQQQRTAVPSPPSTQPPAPQPHFAAVPSCFEQHHESQQQQQQKQQYQQVTNSTLKEECYSGVRHTHSVSPSPAEAPPQQQASQPGSAAAAIASGSSSVPVPPAVLQQMLLAVGAAECDVPLLQCWACYSCAALTG